MLTFQWQNQLGGDLIDNTACNNALFFKSSEGPCIFPSCFSLVKNNTAITICQEKMGWTTQTWKKFARKKAHSWGPWKHSISASIPKEGIETRAKAIAVLRNGPKWLWVYQLVRLRLISITLRVGPRWLCVCQLVRLRLVILERRDLILCSVHGSVFLSACKAKASHLRKGPNYQRLALCVCQLVRLKLVILEKGDLIISAWLCVFVSL
jgi:hypothetical protein